MNNKVLILDFIDAGIFYNDISDMDQKDRICEFGLNIGKRNFEEHSYKKDLVHVNHVSNLLHVMSNKRPVPAFRKVIWERDDEIHELAKNSFIKINDLVENSFDDENIRLKSELVQRGYSSWNSTKKIVSSSWIKLKMFIGEERYNLFISFLKNEYNISQSNDRLEEVLKVLNNDWSEIKKPNIINPKYNKTFDDLIGAKFGIGEYLYLSNISTIGINVKLIRTQIRGISNAMYKLNDKDKKYPKSNFYKISGEIAIPVTETVLNNILNNKLTATFLDGGIAYIKNIKNINDFNSTNYIKL